MTSKTEYRELSKAKVSDARNIVISTCSKGGYTIAQQLEAIESGRVTSVFMKGAFHIDDLNGMYNLRDALNLSIKIMETMEDVEAEWDEV